MAAIPTIRAAFLSLVAILAAAGTVHGAVFGPVVVAVERGPAVHEAVFEADPGAYVLRVQPLGEPAAVTIWLNGQTVVSPRDLPVAGGATLERGVTLAATNVIRIRIIGRPGLAARVWLEPAGGEPVLADCGTATELFSAPPTDLADVVALVPLGSLTPPDHTLPTHHMYVVADEGRSSIPVYAPGDAVLTAVVVGERGGTDDITLSLRPCAQVRLYYLHLNALEPGLEATIGNFPEELCLDGSCARLVRVPLLAGQLLGWAQPKDFGPLGFDIGLVDDRRGPLPFASPARYDLAALGEQPPELRPFLEELAPKRLHQFCALEYFVPELRAAMEPLLGRWDGAVRRTVEPRCGEHMQDIPGTAQGNWFLHAWSSAFWEADETLALVADNIEPDVPVFSISNAFGAAWQPAEIYTFAPVLEEGTVNRHFAAVAPGAVHCYEGLRLQTSAEAIAGVVLVEVFSSGGADPADRLRIERRLDLGSCPVTPAPSDFTTNALTFQR
jgi:hypothetical protein